MSYIIWGRAEEKNTFGLMWIRFHCSYSFFHSIRNQPLNPCRKFLHLVTFVKCFMTHSSPTLPTFPPTTLIMTFWINCSSLNCQIILPFPLCLFLGHQLADSFHLDEVSPPLEDEIPQYLSQSESRAPPEHYHLHPSISVTWHLHCNCNYWLLFPRSTKLILWEFLMDRIWCPSVSWAHSIVPDT